MLSDARGNPAHLAAFCFSEHGVFYTDMGVPDAIMAALKERADEQIMAQV